MPYLQQPDVRSQVPYGRSDHTIPIPRPLHDTGEGLENACRQCHRDQTAERLQSQVATWYGEVKPLPEPVTARLAADSAAESRSTIRRILDANGTHPMAEFVGLTDVLQRYVSPDAPELDQATIGRLEQRATSTDPEIQALALATLHLGRGADPYVRRFLSDQLRALGTREADVRDRWAWILKIRGDSYLNAGDPRNAVLAYERANEVRPDYPSLSRARALAYMTLGQHDKAAAELRRSLALKPGQAHVMVQLGVTLLQGGDIDGATSAFREAITVNPWDPIGYANLGVALLRRSEVRSSIDALEKALSLDPSLADANFMLANAYAALRQPKQAADALERGLEFAPRDAAARRMLDEIRRAR